MEFRRVLFRSPSYAGAQIGRTAFARASIVAAARRGAGRGAEEAHARAARSRRADADGAADGDRRGRPRAQRPGGWTGAVRGEAVARYDPPLRSRSRDGTAPEHARRFRTPSQIR